MQNKLIYYSMVFLLLMTLAGEFGYEIVFEPTLIPLVEIRIDPNSKNIVSVHPKPTIRAPYGQWSVEHTGEFIDPKDVNEPQTYSYMYLIIQDDTHIPNLNEYRIDLNVNNMIIEIDGNKIMSGKIILTSNGIILQEQNGYPYISYRKGHLWIDVTYGQVREIVLQSVDRTIQDKIWYGYNIPPKFCRTIILNSRNFLKAIPVCVAQATESLLNFIPNFLAKQAIFLTDSMEKGTLVGRLMGLLLDLSIIGVCIWQVFNQKADTLIALFLIILLWILITIVNMIL